MEITTTMQYHYTLTKVAEIEKIDSTKWGEEMQLLYTLEKLRGVYITAEHIGIPYFLLLLYYTLQMLHFYK